MRILPHLRVSWCLGDGPLMNGHGDVPKTPVRRVTALPMTDPPVVSMNALTQGPQRRGLHYLPWRGAERVRRFLAAAVQEGGG